MRYNWQVRNVYVFRLYSCGVLMFCVNVVESTLLQHRWIQTVVRNFPFTSDILKLAFYLFWVNLVVCFKIALNSLASVGHHCSFFSYIITNLFATNICNQYYIIVAHSSAPWSFRWSSLLEPRVFARLKFRLQFCILSSADLRRCGLKALFPGWSSAGLQECAFRFQISAFFANWPHPSSNPST